MYSDVYNTTVNINGDTVYSRTFYPGACCFGGGMYMNSCFGYGYAPSAAGFMAGMALAPALPNIFRGIGSALSWVGTKVIVPSAKFLWNSVLVPVGKAIGSAACWVGKTVAKGACAVAKGVKNLWNSIFHKKSKSKTEKAE